MITKLHLENILFLDIETVPEVELFSGLDDTKQQLWETKSKYQRRDEFSAEEFYFLKDLSTNCQYGQMCLKS